MTKLTRRAVLAGGAAGVAAPFLAPRWSWANEPVTLGLVTPLSGPVQLIGNAARVGAEVAVAQVNAAGGIDGRELRLEMRDSKANPNDATVVARELIGQGVNLQFGTMSSTVALAMGPLMDTEGGVVLTCGAGTEKLNHENYNRHVFRIGDNPYSRENGMVRHIAQTQPEVERWLGIIPDHEYGRTTWAIFVDAMMKIWTKETGKTPEILDPILVPYGAGDYKSFITQAARQQVQGIFSSVYGGDAVTLYQQAKPFGLFDRADLLLDSSNEFLVATAMGAQVPKKWTGFHWYYKANAGNPLSDELYAGYVKATGNEYPLGWAAEAQAAVLAYSAAIKASGGTDSDGVIDALKGLTFDSATGPRTIRAEDNQAIKNAEMVLIAPNSDIASGFEVADYISVDGPSVIEPATPGKRLELAVVN